MFGFFRKARASGAAAGSGHKEADGGGAAPVLDLPPIMTVANTEDFGNDPLVAIRRRLEAKVEDLTAQLAAKDAEVLQMKTSLADLAREATTKAAGMERVQAELDAAYRETEMARNALHKFEEQRESFRHQNDDLKEQLERRNSSSEEDEETDSDEDDDDDEDEEEVKKPKRTKAELEALVEKLEAALETADAEKKRLTTELEEAQQRAEEDRKAAAKTAEAAEEERKSAAVRFERLRTEAAEQQQQTLDDFEWKLRQVEQSAKRRLDTAAAEASRRVADIQATLDRRIAAHEADVERMRKLEVEMTQLRGLSHDQQRLLREAQREHDKLQASSNLLDSEISRLKAQLEKERNVLSAVQSLNQRRKEEREEVFQQQLQMQRQEVTLEVKELTRKEMEEEMRAQLEERLEKHRAELERRLLAEQRNAEEKLEAAQRQLTQLRDQMARREEQHQRQLANSVQEADSSRLELRRRLDKIDLSYQDQIEALNEAHSIEVEELERRASQAEMQLVQSKTTLELVKAQMTKDFDERFNDLFRQHQQQLQRHQDELQEVHEEQIAAMQARHEATIAAITKNKHHVEAQAVDPRELQEALAKLRRQELAVSDLLATVREQDAALTTLTQEKRALQLRLSSPGPQQSSPQPRRPPEEPPGGLRRISEHTEPDEEFMEEEEDEGEGNDESEVGEASAMSGGSFLEPPAPDVSPGRSSSSDELQVPRSCFPCRSPDAVFPSRPESSPWHRSRSLDAPATLAPSSPPWQRRALSCPARWPAGAADWAG